MTHSEFKKFLGAAIAAFPTMAEFINASPDPDATAAAWFEALGDCTLEDCRAALRAMAKGDLQRPAFKWDGFTGLIRGHARQLSSERLKENRPEPWKGKAPHVAFDCNSAAALEYVRERMEQEGTGWRREYLLEIWKPGEPGPTFPDGWEPKNLPRERVKRA